MAPAITHFLVGGSILLLFAAPFALRKDLNDTLILWLVPIGGIWGLAPDIHHITPIFRDRLYSLHHSRWTDLFAFHHMLDRPTVRGMYFESVFGGILLALVAVTVYSTCRRIGERDIVAETGIERLGISILAVGAAAGYAAFAVGVLLSVTGQLETVAVLAGREGLVVSALLLVPLSLAGGTGIAIVLEAVGSARHRTQPLAGALAGLLLGPAIWIAFVTLLVPLWLDVALGISVSLPYLHWESLPAMLSFGFVFGLIYATLRGTFTVPYRRVQAEKPDARLDRR